MANFSNTNPAGFPSHIVIYAAVACTVAAGVLGFTNLYQTLVMRSDGDGLLNAQVEARLKSLEDVVAGLQSRKTDEANPSTETDSLVLNSFPDTLMERLAIIEARLSALDQESVEQPTTSDTDTTKQRKHLLNQLEQQGQATGALETLADSHANEAGQSQWGATATDRMNQAFTEEPFFLENGGQLETDCRDTSCKVEWLLPDLGALSEPDHEHLVAMGEYELLTLAARNAENVGRLQTVFSLDGDSPRISVYFKRESNDVTP